ncbi:MAG: hydrogenase maturation nickel metallochaperone HypA [Aquificota bacterium]|nr:MAG: hydrogenase maturation nickel metallochaperone HypA [Aquificota bacterium]
MVQSLLELIHEQVRMHSAKRVVKVEIVAGVLSGVEPHLLQIAFETFRQGTPAEDAELLIEVEKLKIYCRDCEGEFEKDELNALCPRCGGLNTEIRGGRELLLKSLELEVDSNP